MKPAVFLYGVPGQYGNYAAALEAAGARVVLCRDLYRSLDCDGLLLPAVERLQRAHVQQRRATRPLRSDRDATRVGGAEQRQFGLGGAPAFSESATRADDVDVGHSIFQRERNGRAQQAHTVDELAGEQQAFAVV